MSDMPCPFCGSHDIRLIGRGGRYDYDKIHCDGCGTEFTYYPTHIADMWNRREDADSEHCPFCGGEVDFDGYMAHQSTAFVGAYCPRCRWRFEFQGVGVTKTRDRTVDGVRAAMGRDASKARKAFARRGQR